MAPATSRRFAGGSGSSLDVLCLLPMLDDNLPDDDRTLLLLYLPDEGAPLVDGRFQIWASVGSKSLNEKERRDVGSVVERSILGLSFSLLFRDSLPSL